MKLKSFVRVRPGKVSVGTILADDKLRADMFLPAWVLSLGVFFLAFGAIMGILLIALQLPIQFIVLSVALLLIGVAAIMCWKNQKIHMLPDDSFEYSTFLGNKIIYRFSEIKGIKIGRDSSTLFVGEGKVHIESVAVLSPRLEERINKQLDIINNDEK